MKKLKLTDRQWHILTNALSCYTTGVYDDLEHHKWTHNQEDVVTGGKFDERKAIYELAGELRVCENILEKLTGSKKFY